MAQPKHNLESKDNENGKIQLALPKCLQNGSVASLSQDLKIINPDIHELFNKYNELYFDSNISFCELKWTEIKEDTDEHSKEHKKKKTKKYAGQCIADNYGFCRICLEKSILQFKSPKYVIETLIHQMIHSYILTKHGAKSFAAKQKQETIGHSAEFKQIMMQINRKSHPFIKLTLNNKQCKQNDDYPSEIIPNQLYLGNIHHALNLQTLKGLKISHVVNCTQSIIDKFEDAGIIYCRVPVNDKTSVSILPYFVKAIRFIEAVREKNSNNKILIHCHAGISRSATITIAYLMYSWKLTMFDAITHVQSKRYIIQPNQGFKNQLLDFYLYLEENEGNLDDFEKKNQIKAKNNKNENMSCPLPICIGQNDENQNKNVNGNNQKEKEYVACPVCDKFFTTKYINKHLDECVSH